MYDEKDFEVPHIIFTLEEANRLIPVLRPLLQKLMSLRNDLSALQPEIQLARRNALLDGGTQVGPYYVSLLDRFNKELSKIERTGVLVKDFRTGLCDFPHLRDGRLIYLCWRIDEDEVGYWHETDTGFAGRKPI